MKKLKLLIASLAIVALAACNQAPADSDVEDNETPEAVEKNGEPEIDEESAQSNADADEILTKSLEAMNDVESFSMVMDSVQEMNIPGEGTVETKMTMESDIGHEPTRLFQKLSMEVPGESFGAMETETYFTEDGMFIKDGSMDQWIKYPDSYTEDMLSFAQLQSDNTQQLEMLKQFSEEITVAEDDTHYILTIKGEGDSLKEMAVEMMAMLGDDITGGMTEIFDLMEISVFDYELYIDKETYYQTRFTSTVEMSLTFEGETMVTKQTMDSTISNFNNVGEITVPQDVIDSAEEFSFDDFGDFSDLEDFDLEDLEDLEIEEDE
ncbi:DUF6612 family protein [Alkalihalobacterium bogoriense]|uniref:DUF6612 family protein n=1 Tax=Alkalihalobacterium bogoriense TaxID=246272 RepID=UPI00047E0203|nr:DUF6612 family protein [Alkalihalobacterium bogoriense]